MNVLFVGATPPPGGDDALRFGSAAGARSASGDVVVVHAPGRLSVAHAALSTRPAAILRDLRANSRSFDEVVLRLERDRPVRFAHRGARRVRDIKRLLRSLRGFPLVTLFVDASSPVLADAAEADLRGLLSRATSIVVADDADRLALAAVDPALGQRCTVAAALAPRASGAHDWPADESPALWSVSQREIRRRSGDSSSQESLLVEPQGSARPSISGASAWLIRRIIGKTRGAVTKLLRP